MNDPVLEHRILDAVGQGLVTQRELSQKIGCSVSSVNFALRLLAVKGLIKIAGGNPRRLKYYLTPRGIIEKTIIAYDFVKRQRALYEDARTSLLGELHKLANTGVKKVAIYGRPPLAESAMLYLISEGLQVAALYVVEPLEIAACNRIPVLPIDQFCSECEVLVLLEPLAEEHEELVSVPKAICYPVA